MKNVSSERRPHAIGNVFQETGFCYGGFRLFPSYPIPILHKCRSILLVRDPRDMAVSLYFSLLKSHTTPPDGVQNQGARQQIETARSRLASITVDQFSCECVVDYVKMFEGYLAQGFHWRPDVVVYRYEDVIFKKAEWLQDIHDCYGWKADAKLIDATARKFDVVPDQENPGAHIRQVHPGNFAKHLSVATLQLFQKRLGEYMEIFGYA